MRDTTDPKTRAKAAEVVVDLLAKMPRVCPNPACGISLHRAHPACPGCGESLTPAGLKARADAAAANGLGLPDRPNFKMP